MKYFILVLAICMMGVGCKVIGPRLQASNPMNGMTAYTVVDDIEGTGTMTQGMFVVTEGGQMMPLGYMGAATWGKQALGAGTSVISASTFGLFPSWNMESGLRDSGDRSNINVTGGGANANANAGIIATSKINQFQMQGQGALINN